MVCSSVRYLRALLVRLQGDGGSMETVLSWYYHANGSERKGGSMRETGRKKDGGGKQRRRGAGGAPTDTAPIVRREQTGGLLLAVCRGKASEGLDFTDDNARAVVLVGIPFPASQDLRILYKKAYNDDRVKRVPGTLTGSAWYSLQAFRALNQSIGRAIRHRADYGAVLFFDERYTEARTQSAVSKWLRPQIKSYSSLAAAAEALVLFFAANAGAPAVDGAADVDSAAAVGGVEPPAPPKPADAPPVVPTASGPTSSSPLLALNPFAVYGMTNNLGHNRDVTTLNTRGGHNSDNTTLDFLANRNNNSTTANVGYEAPLDSQALPVGADPKAGIEMDDLFLDELQTLVPQMPEAVSADARPDTVHAVQPDGRVPSASSVASPGKHLTRICCKQCFRPVAEVPERTDVTVELSFFLDMVCHVHQRTAVTEAHVVQLPTAFRSQANLRAETGIYSEPDGLVYGLLRCLCTSIIGADVICADQKGEPSGADGFSCSSVFRGPPAWSLLFS
jgi:hypothetical protein